VYAGNTPTAPSLAVVKETDDGQAVLPSADSGRIEGALIKAFRTAPVRPSFALACLGPDTPVLRV